MTVKEPRKPKRTSRATRNKTIQVSTARRNAEIVALVEQGITYREIAERYGLAIGTISRIVDEAVASFLPPETVETVRRILLARAGQLTVHWLPLALGEGETVKLVRQGDDQVPVSVPTDIGEQAKAAEVVMRAADRIAKWSGLEAEMAARAAHDVDRAPLSEAQAVDEELQKLIEDVKGAMGG